MKIEHVYHSGMKIEFNDYIILIDIYNNFEAYKNKKIYYFVTHGHHDHYNKEILSLKENNEVTYIFSDDIKTSDEDIHFVKAGDQLRIDDIDIEVYGSTDLGVSFYIKTHSKSFFHSGDLNWWHWSSFTEEQLIGEEKQFKDVVKKLIGKKIDYYFVPVDYRLASFGYLAFDYVLKEIQPSYVIPMHFADHFEYIKDLKSNDVTKVLKAKKIKDIVFEM